MVIATAARYRLICESVAGNLPVWRFKLVDLTNDWRLEISDFEPQGCEEKRALLALVRGLEAIERHAEVQLVTSSRYVYQGIMYGLSQWREDCWKWEHFGRMVPIKHQDYWQRVDRALEFHRLASVELTPTIGDGQVKGARMVPIVRVHRLSHVTPTMNDRRVWHLRVKQLRVKQLRVKQRMDNVSDRHFPVATSIQHHSMVATA